ncbi:MAG: hypothetical protein GWP06_05675, partial [Actinobacteria bacterium]|nr:hypothetical protein [Actinomycetota bacterium]
KQITEIFTEKQLNKAVVKKAYTFESSVFYGNAEGTFLRQPLPTEAQFSPVYAIMARDFDSDGVKDLLLAGNSYGVKPQLGRYDASYGTLLIGNGAGGSTPLDGSYPMEFTAASALKSGLSLTGQVRDMVSLTYRNLGGGIKQVSRFDDTTPGSSALTTPEMSKSYIQPHKHEVIIIAKNDDRIQIYEIKAR